MSQSFTPRRPAMLSFEDAERLIQGDDDPAATTQLATTSARALIGLNDEEFDAHAVANLVTTINSEGVDVVASLWERSPEFTLPGALWRLYLFNEWFRRDPDVVRQRFDEGLAAPYRHGIDDNTHIPPLDTVINSIDEVMHARLSGSLADLLRASAIVMRVLASGATFGSTWIRSDRDRLATLVTRRAGALLATANELDIAASRARSGRLI